MELKQINDAIDELCRTFEAFKERNDERLKQIETRGRADPELEARVDRINSDLTSIATRLARSGPGVSVPTKETLKPGCYRDAWAGADYDKAFNLYARKGETGNLAELEQKALSVGSDPDGGYTVTEEMSQRIITKVFESSPIWSIATVETISGSALEILVDKDDIDGAWVSETAGRPATATPKWARKEIVAHELYAMPAATQKLLDDSSIDIEAWLGNKLGNKFGRMEATAFVLGNGVGQPRGFLTYPSGTSWGEVEQVNSGDAATITADGLIDIIGALKYPYRQRAAWLMNRDSIASVRKLKDPVTGLYLWQPALVAGQPEQLLGYPIMPAADMPSVAGGALYTAFGDFGAGYTIVSRVGVRVLRDQYTSKPNILFYATKRTGGDVVNFEAFKLGVISA